MKLIDKAYKILKCEDLKILNTRLIKIGLGNVCTRCGGTGQYSYNQKDGTVCYGCVGTGWVAQKVTRQLIATLEEKESNGEVAEYFKDLEKRIADRKWSDEHGFKYLSKEHEKTEISQYFDWWDVSEKVTEIAAINRQFSKAVNLASEAETNKIKARKGCIQYTDKQWKDDIKQANKLFDDAAIEWDNYKEKYNPEKVK